MVKKITAIVMIIKTEPTDLGQSRPQQDVTGRMRWNYLKRRNRPNGNGTNREGLNHRKSDGTLRNWMQCPKSDESSEVEIVGNWREPSESRRKLLK